MLPGSFAATWLVQVFPLGGDQWIQIINLVISNNVLNWRKQQSWALDVSALSASSYISQYDMDCLEKTT